MLLGALLALALAAPLLATDRPWLSRKDGRLVAPVLARAIGPGEVEGRALLRAPVPHDPRRLDLNAVLLPPGRAHWMGTDALGRDLAARVLHGARVSLAVGLLAAALALLVGVPLGAWAGYRGGWARGPCWRLFGRRCCLFSRRCCLFSRRCCLFGRSCRWSACSQYQGEYHGH